MQNRVNALGLLDKDAIYSEAPNFSQHVCCHAENDLLSMFVLNFKALICEFK